MKRKPAKTEILAEFGCPLVGAMTRSDVRSNHAFMSKLGF